MATGAYESGRWFVIPVLLLSSLFTAVYVWRICSLVWFAPAETEAKVTEEVPWSMRIPAMVLAGACLYFGMSSTGADLARQAAKALLP